MCPRFLFFYSVHLVYVLTERGNLRHVLLNRTLLSYEFSYCNSIENRVTSELVKVLCNLNTT